MCTRERGDDWQTEVQNALRYLTLNGPNRDKQLGKESAKSEEGGAKFYAGRKRVSIWGESVTMND